MSLDASQPLDAVVEGRSKSPPLADRARDFVRIARMALSEGDNDELQRFPDRV
jgi:hypothetical protein